MNEMLQELLLNIRSWFSIPRLGNFVYWDIKSESSPLESGFGLQ